MQVLSQNTNLWWINYQHYFEWHLKPIAANLKWNFVFILCRESVIRHHSCLTVVQSDFSFTLKKEIYSSVELQVAWTEIDDYSEYQLPNPD